MENKVLKYQFLAGNLNDFKKDYKFEILIICLGQRDHFIAEKLERLIKFVQVACHISSNFEALILFSLHYKNFIMNLKKTKP